MDNDVDAVVLACRGTLASWSPALEAVAYEQARVNAESPLDRGARLRRRVEELSVVAGATSSLAAGFDRLAAERGWRRGVTGSECRSRVVALARPYADVPPALEAAVGAGLPLIVVSPGDPVLVEGALRPLDGAFDAILTARELGAAGPGAVLAAAARWMATDPSRLLYVSASRAGIAHAGRLGMHRGWVNRTSDRRRPPQLRPDEEWPSLRRLGAFLGVGAPTLPVAG
jgi:FMN phosphatase YigB (HAD superfamily)